MSHDRQTPKNPLGIAFPGRPDRRLHRARGVHVAADHLHLQPCVQAAERAVPVPAALLRPASDAAQLRVAVPARLERDRSVHALSVQQHRRARPDAGERHHRQHDGRLCAGQVPVPLQGAHSLDDHPVAHVRAGDSLHPEVSDGQRHRPEQHVFRPCAAVARLARRRVHARRLRLADSERSHRGGQDRRSGPCRHLCPHRAAAVGSRHRDDLDPDVPDGMGRRRDVDPVHAEGSDAHVGVLRQQPAQRPAEQRRGPEHGRCGRTAHLHPEPDHIPAVPAQGARKHGPFRDQVIPSAKEVGQ
ncbi:hypothetical protein BN871_CG_00040 [Paenibacillus sp. P22]|nr:hypothetical protein BN871_CG_00040 [Paenibacillus sp. P22]